MTCSSATKAASCVAGYYLKSEDGTCVACPTNSTCTSATVFTCNAGYYNASGTCTLCGNNVALCTGVTSTTASTNITECIKPDGTNIYYLTAKGC